MICQKCNTEMKIQSGRFGEFYFCPNQLKCGCKTISKKDKTTYTEFDSSDYGSFEYALNQLIPNYTKEEIEGMYADDEIDALMGIQPEWQDAFIGM